MTDFSAISNFIGDCYQYFRSTADFNFDDDDKIVYDLLCIAKDICDKHLKNEC